MQSNRKDISPAKIDQNKTYRIEKPPVKLQALANSLGAIIKVEERHERD